MQIPEPVSNLYRESGPFATVYLDASRTTADARSQLNLRWRHLRDSLAGQGCDRETLAAVDQIMGDHFDISGRRGQAIFAAGGRVLLNEFMPHPPAGELGCWSALPRVLPLLRQMTETIPHTVVRVDRTGADIHTVLDHVHSVDSTVTGGAEGPMHKTGRNVWSERTFQHRVDNTWDENARNVASQVCSGLSDGVKIVLVTGDIRARTMVLDHLRDTLPNTVYAVSVDHGSRSAGSSPEALNEAVHNAVLQYGRHSRGKLLERLRQGLGRADYAVTGVPMVVEATRKAQVETLVLSERPTVESIAAIGPGALQIGLEPEELETFGVTQSQHVRLDEALVRAVAHSGAALLLVPGENDFLLHGVGALLRYPGN